MGVFVHIVLVKFKDNVSDEQIRGVCERILSLKDKCVHPETKTPYIKSFTGGRNSLEGNQDGMTHAFVVEFEKAADREYYLHLDPEHIAFRMSIKDLAAGAQAFDYEHGVL